MFAWGARTYVMGIVNCSPDSFSGDGHATPEAAIEHGLRLADSGADVLDVGGESTRPGSRPVTAAEETDRVLPVIEALARRAGVLVSVDTSKAAVAGAALRAGASMVNDVRALRGDAGMGQVVASSGAHVVLMDNRLAPSPYDAGYAPRVGPGEQKGGAGGSAPRGEEIVTVVIEWLTGRVQAALGAGIARERIVIDPGLGFGKLPAQSFALLRSLHVVRAAPVLAGLPLLVGPSRKGFIGHALGLPAEERLEGTLAAVALAIAGGADMVRVHDVRAAVKACRIADAIVRPEPPPPLIAA